MPFGQSSALVELVTRTLETYWAAMADWLIADRDPALAEKEKQMGSTTPAMYYWYFIEPNYRDLCERANDVRLGFNAAISAFHMSDVFLLYYARRDPKRVAAYYEGRKPREARKYVLRSLGQQEPGFVIVQSAATVYKHLYSAATFLDGNSPQSFGGVTSARRVVSVESNWSSSAGDYISVRRRSGQVVSLNEALDDVVMRLWPSILGRDLTNP